MKHSIQYQSETSATDKGVLRHQGEIFKRWWACLESAIETGQKVTNRFQCQVIIKKSVCQGIPEYQIVLYLEWQPFSLNPKVSKSICRVLNPKKGVILNYAL